jgi:hypothetical protein
MPQERNMKKSLGVISAVMGTLCSIGSAGAAIVDINGGNAWGGWDFVGNAQTNGVWVAGSTTRDYNIYRTRFTLESGQTVGGSRLANGAAGNGLDYTGDTQANLFAGSWQAGDRIVGVGLQYTGGAMLTTLFLHVDSGGNNIFAASSVGANDSAFSHDVGDTASYVTSMPWVASRHQTNQYSIWNGFSPDGSIPSGNYTFPYGQGPTNDTPIRSFAILGAGEQLRATSAQYFVNIDAILRSNGGLKFGEGPIDDFTKFGFWEGDETLGEGVFSQQIFAIPAPGALALLGLAGLAGARRRR